MSIKIIYPFNNYTTRNIRRLQVKIIQKMFQGLGKKNLLTMRLKMEKYVNDIDYTNLNFAMNHFLKEKF